jgi:hypothetical protein
MDFDLQFRGKAGDFCRLAIAGDTTFFLTGLEEKTGEAQKSGVSHVSCGTILA